MEVCVRIAPSPTGDGAHIGLARTALFNWLFARRHGGTFILRSEDTDLERSKREYESAIQRDLQWLGLDWDQFHRQSDRLPRYQQAAQRLLELGAAYHCYCTPQELEAQQQRAAAHKQSHVYEGRCRLVAEGLAQGGQAAERAQAKLQAWIAQGRAPAVRFKVQDYAWDQEQGRWVDLPKPAHRARCEEGGAIVVHDLIKGDARYEPINPAHDKAGAVISDFVILRSEGMPTYNFAVVVDDVDMGVTHVIRGDEHLNNTPRQMLIYTALDKPMPQFAHLPMVLDKGRKKLSKRRSQMDVFVSNYREKGFLPQAMVNFLARLGWSCGDQEIFSLRELIENFSLERVNTASAVFDDEKLRWLNQHYIKSGNPQELAPLLRQQLIDRQVLTPDQAHALQPQQLQSAVTLLAERVGTLGELAQAGGYLFREDFSFDPDGVGKYVNPETVALLEAFAQQLAQTDDFSAADDFPAADDFSAHGLERFTEAFLATRGKALKHFAQPARLALTGRTQGAGLFETLAFFGRAGSIRRLQRAVAAWKG